MAFPERFSNLPDYAFPRLRKLLDAHAPGGEPIAMTIGEPRHAMPDFVGSILAANLSGFRNLKIIEGDSARPLEAAANSNGASSNTRGRHTATR